MLIPVIIIINLQTLVDKFCELFEKNDTADRESILDEIIRYIDNTKSKTKYNVPENKETLADRKHTEHKSEMENLRKKIFDMKHELMKYIVEPHMAGFNSKILQRFS